MTDVLAVLTSPFYHLIDLALESPLAALGGLCIVGLLVVALVV